jgi:hypothetical protein
VEAVTDFSITGRLARFGRGGMIQDISNRLLRDFADCLQAKLVAEGRQAGGAAVPAGAGSPAAVPPDTRAPGGDADGPVPVSPPPGDRPLPPEVGAPASRAEQESPAPVPPPGMSAGGGASGARASGSPPPAKPVRAMSLLFSVLWERIKRFVAARRRAH